MTASGGSADDTAIAPLAAGAGAAVAARLPTGADPDAVRDWFDLETIVELPAPALSFAEAEAAAADYRRAARADNTRRAYRAAVARFTDWCAIHRQAALPASPETVAAFLAAEARSGLAVNTLRLRHAALRYLHLLAGYPPPTASPLVSATFAGIRRAHRRPLRKKTALVTVLHAPSVQHGLTRDIRGEARIVERAFGLGGSILAEVVQFVSEQLELEAA